MSETTRLTLLNIPGTMSLWHHTPAVETDFVAAIKPLGQEPIYRHGVDSAHNFSPVHVDLPTARASRLVLLFRKLYSPERDTEMYDCLSGMDFICGTADELDSYHEYTTTGPVAVNELVQGEPHIILSGNKDKAIHGMLATDNSHAVHVAGPKGDLAYSFAAHITEVWQGDLVRVTTIHRQ